MRYLILIFFTINLLLAASVDTRLFEGSDKESYFDEIQKQIDTSPENSQHTKEIIQDEKRYLAKLRSASSQIVQIETSYIQGFDTNSTISLEYYYSVLNEAAALRLTLKSRRQMLDDIQSKLLFTKGLVENIVEEDKSKLLSYQLQFAYYKLQSQNIEDKLSLLQTHEEETIQMLISGLSRVECDTAEVLATKLSANDADIEKVLQQKISLQIDLEKAEIEESAKFDSIKNKVLAADQEYNQLLSAKCILKIEKSICILKNKKNKAFFTLLDEVETVSKDIAHEEQDIYMEQVGILRDMAKKVFGATKLFFGATLHEVSALWSKTREAFSAPLFVFNERPISVFSLVKVLVLIAFGLIIGSLYKRWIARISYRWPDMSQMSVRLASNIGYYLIVIVTFVIAIGSIGIDMTSISLIAGALSIGIGFGLQTVVSNLIAGIILMFERTIRIGDTVEISDIMRGRVTDMRIRSTTIKTFDNVDIVVPNSSFIQNNVINWTLDDLSRRLHIPFGVAYGTDIQTVKDAILKELNDSDLIYIKDDDSKNPEIWMIAMNSSSVDLELLVWVEWDNKHRPNSFRSDFLILIYNALNKYGIQIPFPQLDLHVKSMPS